MKTPPRFWAIVLAVTVSILTSASSLQAGIVTFDFESTPATFISPPDSSRPGALTSLGLSSSGLTISISRTNSTHFDIVDNNGNQAGKSASFGNRSLDPFFSPGPNTGFIVNFSSALSAFQLSFGDYGQDAETLTLNAYSGLNGTGTVQSFVLASNDDSCGGGACTWTTTALSFFGTAQSVDFGSNSGQALYTGIGVTPVPLPASGLLMLFGSAGLGLFRSRRRAA